MKERAEVELAAWARGLERSSLQEMLTATARPGIISFALGLPAPEFFPAADFSEAAARVLSEDARALQYSPPFEPLKRHVVELMKRRGVVCRAEQIFLTAGAQQGMSLLARLLLDEGRSIITEELIYTGFQQVVKPFRPRILTVPTDSETGMDVEAVSEILRRGERPAFIYCITDGHNPLSVRLHPSKRARLVELSEHYGVPIIEDDAYGFLCYEETEPPLRALGESTVLYAGSFSKILAPALRVGWVIVPEEMLLPLSVVKESSDIDTATFTQRLVTAYLDTGRLESHVENLRREYRLRRDTMLRALEEHFPEEARWRKPESGVFCWVELADEFDAFELFRKAIEHERVAFIPGQAFGVREGLSHAPSMRLNFSHSAPGLIEEGIPRLARVLKGSRPR
ncbi:MAG TPA: PLP-dependent aminotransferase family protein [Pyrinomonadaceae bacterium]|jgi:2-aminoadipate transaminase